jgi:hypothetical protein
VAYFKLVTPVNVVLALPPFTIPPFTVALSSGRIRACVTGCVHIKGDRPRPKNSSRSGIRGKTGSKKRKESRVSVRTSEV